jgi:hypothetical protein
MDPTAAPPKGKPGQAKTLSADERSARSRLAGLSQRSQHDDLAKARAEFEKGIAERWLKEQIRQGRISLEPDPETLSKVASIVSLALARAKVKLQ